MSIPTTDFADLVALVRDQLGIYDSEFVVTDEEVSACLRAANAALATRFRSIWNFRVGTGGAGAQYITPALDLQGVYADALVRTATHRLVLQQSTVAATSNPGEHSMTGVGESGSSWAEQLRRMIAAAKLDADLAAASILGYNRPRFSNQ